MKYSKKRQSMKRKAGDQDSAPGDTHYEEFLTMAEMIPDLTLNTVTHLRSAGLNYGLMQGG